MSSMWKYLDKRSAAVAAIKDYASMRFIINNTDDEIKKAYEKIAATNWADQEFQVDINDTQVLDVKVSGGVISKWQVENVSSWEADSTQPVITIDD